MRQEIEFFRKKLLPTSDICWKSLIAHVIPRMPTFTTFGDSCLEGAGDGLYSWMILVYSVDYATITLQLCKKKTRYVFLP